MLALSLSIWREGGARPPVLPWLLSQRAQDVVAPLGGELLELRLLDEVLAGEAHLLLQATLDGVPEIL